MAHSFTLDRPAAPARTAPEAGGRRRVLVTGAAGTIGAFYAEHARDRYDLRLMIRTPLKDEQVQKLKPFGEIVGAGLDDLDAIKAACRGVDTVVHLAGNPDANAAWGDLLDSNVVGTYNVMVAAKSAGCRRVIYASSIHAVSGYPPGVQVKTNEPVNPGDLYGVSKCFGEALGRYLAEREGISVIALRIGAFQPHESARSEGGLKMTDGWVSQRDLCQLIDKCIEAEGIRWAVFHGLSGNRFNRLDISDARELVGYAPQDDLTNEHPALKPLGLATTISTHSQADAGTKSGIRDEV